MCSIFKLLLTVTSAVIGLLLLVASALAMEEYKDGISQCFKKGDSAWIFVPDTMRMEYCTPFFALTGVIGGGFLASVIQLISCLYSLVRKDHGGRSWRGSHAFIFVLTVIGFAVGIHYFGGSQDEFIHSIKDIANLRFHEDKNKLLIAAHGIDWIFCICAIILANFLPADHKYGRPSEA